MSMYEVEYDPEFWGYYGGCAVEAATTSVRSELNGACAIAVSNAITPLLNELTPLLNELTQLMIKCPG